MKKILLSMLGIMFYASTAFGEITIDIKNNTNKTVFVTFEVKTPNGYYPIHFTEDSKENSPFHSYGIEVRPHKTIKDAVKNPDELSGFNLYNDEFNPENNEVYQCSKDGKFLMVIEAKHVMVGNKKIDRTPPAKDYDAKLANQADQEIESLAKDYDTKPKKNH